MTSAEDYTQASDDGTHRKKVSP